MPGQTPLPNRPTGQIPRDRLKPEVEGWTPSSFISFRSEGISECELQNTNILREIAQIRI
jgi:hypothetical protein